MNIINTMIKNTKKKAFTLIELLIVVAIIGILAGVGVPMYNGYMASAKVESAKTNHSNIKSYVAATLTKCAVDSSQIIKLGSRNVRCNYSASQWASEFTTYFNLLNKNPYGGTTSARRTSSSSTLGETSIYYSGSNTIRLRTRIADSGTQYAPASGYDEITKE
jgi:type IV pilus assembly protein PilA